MMPVDIIIPVYKGLAETLACLNSVFASQANNRCQFKVIVINDASPEPELCTALVDLQNKQALGQQAFQLIEHTENQGFVKTVNEGMRQSQHDVVLLNSDTVVAGNWLDKLHFFAQTRDIATVTPLSNNATICSYPLSCEDNALPADKTTFYNQLCEQAHPKQCFDIPTGVGFCLYIQRAALVALGEFDALAFARGYGEENDFCLRAINAGWRNVVALDTYVFHHGSVSFSHEKKALQKQGEVALLQKHPDYSRQLKAFIESDPLASYRHALYLWELAALLKQRPNQSVTQLIFDYDTYQQGQLRFDADPSHLQISLSLGRLVITHPDLITNVLIDAHNRDSCVRALSSLTHAKKSLSRIAYNTPMLKGLYDAIVLPAQPVIIHLLNHTGGGTTRYVEDLCQHDHRHQHVVLYFTKQQVVFYDVNQALYTALASTDLATLAKTLVQYLNEQGLERGLFHLHSFFGKAFDFAEYLRNQNGHSLGGVATVHDHYFLSDHAFSQRNQLNVDAQKVVRSQALILQLERLIAPSDYINELIKTHLRLPKRLCQKIEHGVTRPVDKLSEASAELAHSLMRENNWNVRQETVAIVGAISEQKGLAILPRLIKKLGKQVVLIGYTGHSLKPHSQKRFIQHGPYLYEELTLLLKLYGASHVLFLPGIAESYCYALSDLNAQFPVIAPNKGAFAYRVPAENRGLCYDESLSVQQLSRFVDAAIKQLPPEQQPVNPIETMIENTQKIYQQAFQDEHHPLPNLDATTEQVLLAENFDEREFRLALVHLAKDNYFLRQDIKALFAKKYVGIVDEIRIKLYPLKMRSRNIVNRYHQQGLLSTLKLIVLRIKQFIDARF